MIVKKHLMRDGRLILAVCDNSLKGKKFEEGSKQLDLSTGFYDGEEMDSERLIELFKVAYVINLVGKESIEFALKQGIIDEDKIIEISGVPHAECVMMRE